MTARQIFSGTPSTYYHTNMMIYMKKSHLILFLSEYEKNCLQQIQYFKQEIQPYCSGDLFSRQIYKHFFSCLLFLCKRKIKLMIFMTPNVRFGSDYRYNYVNILVLLAE